MVDGRIVMPNVVVDENVGPHNLFWQFSMQGQIAWDGTKAYFKTRQNSTGLSRTAPGIYEVQTRRFDAIDGQWSGTAIHIFCNVCGLPGPNFVKGSFTGGSGGASKFLLITHNSAGVPSDLTPDQQFINYWIVSRRYRGGNTDQGHNYLVTLHGFQQLFYWMGVEGLGFKDFGEA